MLAAHHKDPAIEVQVGPPQPHHLAAAEARAEEEQDHHAQRVADVRGKEARRVVGGPDGELGGLVRWRRHQAHDVDLGEACGHGVVEHPAQHLERRLARPRQNAGALEGREPLAQVNGR